MQIAGSFGISYHGDNQNEYNQQNIALIFSLFCRLYSSPRGDGNYLCYNNCHYRQWIILIPARGRKLFKSVNILIKDGLYSSPRGDGNI